MTPPNRAAVYWQMRQQGLGAELLAVGYMAAWAASQGRKFYLDSSKWNFYYHRGWQDYFVPYFAEIRLARWLGILDINKPRLLKTRLQNIILRTVSGGKLFCPLETFWKIWCRQSSEKEIKPFFVANRRFSRLGDAASEILRQAFVPWKGVREEARFRFPGKQQVYEAAIFMRGGDKEGEISQPSLDRTHEILSRLKKNRGHLFLASDDYEKISALSRRLPRAKVCTFCPKNQRGHFQHSFNRQDSETRRMEMLRYIQEIHMMKKAKLFVAPFSSNFSRLVYILRNGSGCETTDLQFCLPTPFA